MLSATSLQVDLPAASDLSVAIYDLQGRLIETLVSGYYERGIHSISWSAQSQSSGIYFARIAAGEYSRNVKLVLLK